MKLKKFKIKNFRSYKDEVVIDCCNLTVFVGRNDIGKSTILEAMDIFFNDGKGVIKIDKDDINKKCEMEGDLDIVFSAVFSDVPSSLVIDASNPTSLENEYLLNREGDLEIIKKYPNAGKEKVFTKSYHPTNANCADLLNKKITDLKKLLVPEMACEDKTKSACIRKSIWSFYSSELNKQEIEIDLLKIDEKSIWDQIKVFLPMYALFQSDRKNSDGDSEVQDPLKLAVQEILKDPSLLQNLVQIAEKVEEKLKSVAEKTFDKLREMNPDIAESLKPIIPGSANLKWIDVFKNVSISDNNDIPINKRGSGVKRLVLLNFFRAEVERRQSENGVTNIIYAIEEPETSQHPKHQNALIVAFKELANINNVQIILTTHSPAIVKMLEFENIKLIQQNDVKQIINVQKNKLPYPSLNEVNYLAFNEANEEYHNELYGLIEGEGKLNEFKNGRPTRSYNKLQNNGTVVRQNIILSEYIRHLIHHPENTNNPKYTVAELIQSVQEMRQFIQDNNL